LEKNNKTMKSDLSEEFLRLVEIMDELREKCPWDKKQTFESIRHLSIEEVYELSDAILEKDFEKIKNELGDLLLHVVFYAKMGSEGNHFSLQDVVFHVCEKLIRRHPHIYGDTKVTDDNQVKENWEKIKMKERVEKGNKDESVLDGVPVSMPSLVKSIRVQEKVKAVGFDWERVEDVSAKVKEEWAELEKEIEEGNKDGAEEEFGDLLFSMVNYARFLDINPEDALEKTNRKFIGRFKTMERLMKNEGVVLGQVPLEVLDRYWNKAKEK
jgi:MazG family protein